MSTIRVKGKYATGSFQNFLFAIKFEFRSLPIFRTTGESSKLPSYFRQILILVERERFSLYTATHAAAVFGVNPNPRNCSRKVIMNGSNIAKRQHEYCVYMGEVTPAVLEIRIKYRLRCHNSQFCYSNFLSDKVTSMLCIW